MSAYDLVISGGTVIDPATGLHGRRDVAIGAGRIAAVEEHLAGTTAETVIDASGALVVPGLVDLHVHVYPGVADLSVEADPTCLGRGATTVVDAGSAGANKFPGFRRWIVAPGRGRILAFLNISAMGPIDPFLGELHDLRFADPERAAAVALANVTHAYTGWQPGAIVSDAGRLVPGAREARTRGVRFDVGHGAGSFTWPVAEAALADGFRPDSISSDLHRFNIASPVHDLATTLSKFLLLGLGIDEVIAMATTAPAASLGQAGSSLGALAIGAEADVTVLRLEDGLFPLTDSAGTMREARQQLVPFAVVRAGRQVPIAPLITEKPRGISPG